jgi:hypothetical protein
LLGSGTVKYVSVATDTDATIEVAVFSIWSLLGFSAINVFTTTNHTTIEGLLKVVFSMQSVLRLYNEDNQLISLWSGTGLKAPRAIRE